MKETVLITGASGGLGLEFAKIFAQNGNDLILVARSENKLTELQAELIKGRDIRVEILPMDLSKPDAADDVFAFTSERGLSVDILLNNAGFGDFGRFADCDWAKQDEMMKLNMLTLTRLCYLYLKPMLERSHGRIMNTGSIASFMPGPMMPVYYATKAYVLSLTQAIAAEIRGTGVTITALCPGPTKTGFEQKAELGQSKLFKVLHNMKAADVAQYGYKQLLRGKVIAIPGFSNKALVMLSKLAPRSWVRSLVYKVSQ